MKQNFKITTLVLLTFIIAYSFLFAKKKEIDNQFLSYIVNPQKQNIQLFWKDEKQQNFSSIQQLKSWLEQHHQKLVFAMNAGMYTTNHSPCGLFIENGKLLHPLNKSSGSGNFFLQPNGVFYITTYNTATVCKTSSFVNNGKVKYATQSGPMLVIDSKINDAFKAGSANVNIRNGVGILANNQVVFVMSKTAVSLYDFADYFKKLGCKNALYLDGFVSRTYLPEKNWMQRDGDFGVMVGITDN